MLNEIDKNNLSKKLIGYAILPDFMYHSKWEEYKTKLQSNALYMELEDTNLNDYYSKKENKELDTIGKLLDRNLIEKKKDKISHNSSTCCFKITNYGYNSMLEYRQWYKFWLPLIISFASFIISLIALYN